VDTCYLMFLLQNLNIKNPVTYIVCVVFNNKKKVEQRKKAL